MNHSAWSRTRAQRETEAGKSVVETEVWECADENCPCWMRKGLTFEEQPKCPMCGADMQPGVRMLPRISDKEPK